jgi:hypothetical protein
VWAAARSESPTVATSLEDMKKLASCDLQGPGERPSEDSKAGRYQ